VFAAEVERPGLEAGRRHAPVELDGRAGRNRPPAGGRDVRSGAGEDGRESRAVGR
jgi:hypothetical protein